MSEYETNLVQNEDDEIDLGELLNVLWINRLFIAALIGIFSIVSLIISLFLTNIYTAQATLAPTPSEDISANLSRYAGLASLAGITLPGSSSGISDKDLALTLIKSKTILSILIEKHNILPDLVAAKSWDLSSNSIIYDPQLYDNNKKKWVRRVKPPYGLIPSTQEAFELYDEIVVFSEDKKTQIITLEVSHLSPDIAFQWLNLIIQEVNGYLAEMRIKEAQLSIDYLNDQLEITPYPELRNLFYQLIQQYTQTMMLAKVKTQYALTTLDAPLIPEEESSPSRPLIVILCTLLGGLVATLIILVRFYGFKLKDPIKISLVNYR